MRIRIIKRVWFFLCLWPLCIACQSDATGQVPSPEDSPQARLDLLVKDSTLLRQVHLNSSGIRMEPDQALTPSWHIFPEEYAATRALLQKKTAAEMVDMLNEKGLSRWKDADLLSQSHKPSTFQYDDSSQYPLQGLKVALDPGHMAGDMDLAELEGKYVKMQPSPRTEFERISFFEANLTLATAHLIRKELEALGAQVLMTRTEPGLSSTGMDYATWKMEKWDSTLQATLDAEEITEKRAKYYREEAPEDKILNHFFVREDLRNRARMINAYQPDLTLIIHYNVDAPNWLNRNEAGEFIPTDENYAMAFVPGAFMKGELDKAEDRVDFLRLMLFPEEITASVRLSDLFLQQSQTLTSVPRVEAQQGLTYLENACILSDKKAVYARNLSLTRMIKGPLVYGESLCQDHVEESKRLNKKKIEVEGIWVSDRVNQVANAYMNAVLEFARDM